jgi:hypothetical protein
MVRPDGSEYLSEEQAHALWRRAAQLQADAADRRDDRTRLLAAGEAAADTAIHVSDVEQAGQEAGIAPEFIRLARAETIAEGSQPMSPRWERATDLFVGNERRVIEVTRTFATPPHRVLEIVGRVFPANPFYLNLVETLGEPGAGGVMIFDITRRGEAATSFSWDMLIADIKQLLFMIRPSEESEDATDAVLVASLNYARKLNLGLGSVVTAVAGTGGAAAGAAIGAGAFGLGALAVLPAIAGFAGLGALCVAGWRPMYRWGLGRGTRALEGLLRSIDLRLRTGGIIPQASAPDDPPASRS